MQPNAPHPHSAFRSIQASVEAVAVAMDEFRTTMDDFRSAMNAGLASVKVAMAEVQRQIALTLLETHGTPSPPPPPSPHVQQKQPPKTFSYEATSHLSIPLTTSSNNPHLLPHKLHLHHKFNSFFSSLSVHFPSTTNISAHVILNPKQPSMFTRSSTVTTREIKAAFVPEPAAQPLEAAFLLSSAWCRADSVRRSINSTLNAFHGRRPSQLLKPPPSRFFHPMPPTTTTSTLPLFSKPTPFTIANCHSTRPRLRLMRHTVQRRLLHPSATAHFALLDSDNASILPCSKADSALRTSKSATARLTQPHCSLPFSAPSAELIRLRNR
ncbi:hypothetical protein Salat_0519200 [Sesamum alatum]|uniref:Uncharacterized protein n=1 Tax=Sesamum alatum TaxID=300844 RepID=A0AAE2D103_9LAMI|nr:hypothetical protein Salat_0519200 [Sesamum alatum]